MSPRQASATIRRDLIAAAARLIAQEGPAALTLRRVASEVGTSTMAVYTHFGGMDELRREVRNVCYVALAARLDDVAVTEAPLADLVELCRAYNAFAIDHPDLYRVMFLEAPLDEADAAACAQTFTTLTAAVARCVDVEALAPGDPEAIATELWACGHGVATLEITGLLTREQAAGVATALRSKLLTAQGADPAELARA